MSGRYRRFVAVFVLGHAVSLCGVLSVAAQEPAVGGSIAVIPFTNVTGQSADDWIGDGIAEVVAVDLSQLGRSVIGVIPDAVMNGAKGEREVDQFDGGVLAGADQVRATWMVSGTFQHVGQDLRVTARVVEVSSGGVVHRVKIDGSMHDLFALQDRVAEAIVEGFTKTAPAQTAVLPRDLEVPPREVGRPDNPLGPGSVTGALTLNRPEGVEVSSGGAATGAGFMRPARAAGPATGAVRTSRPPVVDGRLDDVVWSNATHITEFVQMAPLEGAPGTEETEVWIAYDRDNLYFAFYAHHSDPGIIRANRSERDETPGDDSMSVMFDPFMDQQRAYQFSVNGYGIQSDSIVNAGQSGGSSGGSRSARSGSSGGASSSGSGGSRGRTSSSSSGIRGDDSWDALFDTRGQPVDDGWTAEMAIPFKSLRYPSRPSGQPHRWGFQIVRVIRGKGESQVWAPVSRSIAGQLNQMGELEGLTDLSTSRNLEFLPTVTAVRAGSLDRQSGSFNEGNADGEAGFGVKYGVTPDLTADFTYNPDFSQIESDRPQIETNQRFALFFPEQRPFFLEGQEIFSTATPINLVHTRTIVDPRYGGKLTGKLGSTSVGIVVANDEAPGRLDDTLDPAFGQNTQFFLGRARYDLYPQSYVGAVVTAREFGDDFSRVAGVDGRFRLGQTHNLSFLVAASENKDELEGRLSGPVFEFDFRRQGRRLGYSVSHSRIDPEFRTATGFVPRVDMQQTIATASYKWWPEATLLNWGPTVTYLRNYNHAGVLEDEHLQGQVDLEFQRNIRFTGTLNRTLERFGGIDFRKNGYSLYTVLSGRILSLVPSVNWGDGVFFSDDPFLGRSRGGNLTVIFRPTSRLRSDLRGIFSQFVDPRDDTELFDVKILRIRLTYQFTDRLLLRHILEHNTSSRTLGNNLLLTYRINSGTVVFVGYDDRYQQGSRISDAMFPTTSRFERTNRAVFTKFSYLFRY